MPFAKQLKLEVGVISPHKKVCEILPHYNNLLAIFYYSTTGILSYFPLYVLHGIHVVESQNFII